MNTKEKDFEVQILVPDWNDDADKIFLTAAAAYRISRNDLPNRKDVSAML
jgi:hypothetical protein